MRVTVPLRRAIGPSRKSVDQRHHPRDQSENRRTLVSSRHEKRKRSHKKQPNSGQGISHQRLNLASRAKL